MRPTFNKRVRRRNVRPYISNWSEFGKHFCDRQLEKKLRPKFGCRLTSLPVPRNVILVSVLSPQKEKIVEEKAIAMHKLPAATLTLGRIVSAFVFLCVVTATVNAYTVIMRGGRRIEIPSKFVVTTSTLTYEVSAGVQVTLNLAAIDIAATETANNELAGSLLRRVTKEATVSHLHADQDASATPASTLPLRHTVTNSDLESSRRRRLESESAYERRRKELGLPSVEESRRQAALESDSIATELEPTRTSERESESYWRARATELRTEIAALDAQIRFVRSQLDEPLYSGLNGSFASVTSFVPFVSFGNSGRHISFGSRGVRPLVFGPPRNGAQLSGRVVFGGGASRGQVLLNPRRFDRSRQFGLPLFGWPNTVAWQPYDISERSQLITQFNELGAARAGLSARWRELEDEARRAGAPPGWLRP